MVVLCPLGLLAAMPSLVGHSWLPQGDTSRSTESGKWAWISQGSWGFLGINNQTQATLLPPPPSSPPSL